MSDDNVESLGSHRATHNSYNWTPLECLEELVRDLKAGRIHIDKMAVLMSYQDGDNEHYPARWVNLNNMEGRGLLASHMAMDAARLAADE